jgi:ABC-type lipoprotein release transport system permease subunit
VPRRQWLNSLSTELGAAQTMVASLVPAVRAVRADPVEVLRAT